jgi:replicative DNA helicase
MPTVSFSPEQQLALLGHLVNEQRVYDAAVHLGYKPEMLDEPNTQRIFGRLDEFARKFHRHPTLEELKIALAKGEGADSKVTQASLRTLDLALTQAKTVGLETVFDDLVHLRVGSEFLTGMVDLESVWNKQMQDEAVAKLHNLSRKLDHMSSNGLTAMAKSSADWYDISIARREATPERLVYTGLSFLDEPMYGIRPDDLVIVTASTGVGKSQIMALMAWNMAAMGKKVKLFALEAAKGEMEARLQFAKIQENYYGSNVSNGKPIDYVEWSRGLRPDLKLFEPKPEELKAVLANINITYKVNSRYTIETLERDILAVAKDVDIILVDHLHYIDKGDKKSETEALSDIVQRIRDVNLTIDRPIVLAAHVRKHTGPRRDLVLLPSIDDIHGSSDISKAATWIVALGQPNGVDEEKVPLQRLRQAAEGEGGQPTFVRILKSRDGGGTRTSFTMVTYFKRGQYRKLYTVGRLAGSDTKWLPLTDIRDRPTWAKSFFLLAPPETGKLQPAAKPA